MSDQKPKAQFTDAELNAMMQEAESQGMAPSAAKDAASELQGGTGFMGGFTGAMKRTGLGLEQAKTYATGTDDERVGINEQIKAHEAEMAQGGPAGAIGDMAGTAAQFMGPQGAGSALSKLMPKAVVKGTQIYLGKPGSVLRSATQGGAYESTQPVSPSDASTDEYLKGKGVQAVAGTAVGAAAGAAGKFLTREGVPIPPERQKMVNEAELYKMPLTPGERTGYKPFLEAEMGFKSKAGSAPLMLKPGEERQAVLNREAAKAIGSAENAPTESVLALQREIAAKGYAPIAKIPKMSWDTAYMTELDKLADKQMRRVGGSTDVVGVISRLKTGAGKLTGDDFLQELQTVRNMGFDAKKNGQSATASQLKSLG
ncbi:MAG: hypothetical protein HOP00_07960, partial [Nitrospira sp.]|nr:hypothetical protein [Nitrospira sp.]